MTATSNQIKSKVWDKKQEYPLTTESLRMLLENRIPLIRLKEFATPQECEMLVNKAELFNFDCYQNVNPKIERIGITVFEYNRISKTAYFQAVERTTKLRDCIMAASFNPLERLMLKIRECTGATVRIASEPLYGSYYAGLIRKIERGTKLHIDYAPLEQSKWEIGTVIYQLSWNLYLKFSPSNHGQTRIYDRQWQPGDDQYKLDSYGYGDTVIADADAIAFQPYVGDVFIFNTRNYHTVEPMDGQRVTFTSAIGLLPNGEIILWS
ncbi:MULTISPECIES: 2OG-Fe(II)-dependent halogenase WelO5 family protein [Nostoc]|uniref:Prolyl 4-hydroxylase alpha subunit Fe(2+) 2OG dioxygenase domain-containing protein n=2 Tax=Nostoc TaxID=1177 RepID=A0ABR8ICH1_9NOSO|nr:MULTISPECIES: hypothetical protein [Nostoc]MBD2562854.1 hypothetical protein [Nostoc linckia FACHB-391]MBD2648574.1 hypothetical protein [Nostoc foliaceum FACHB-393]